MAVNERLTGDDTLWRALLGRSHLLALIRLKFILGAGRLRWPHLVAFIILVGSRRHCYCFHFLLLGNCFGWVVIKVDFLASLELLVILRHLVPHVHAYILVARPALLLILPSTFSIILHHLVATSKCILQLALARHVIWVMFHHVLHISPGRAHAELLSQLTMNLPDLLPLLFFFEFEFSAHLIHWVADDAILDQITTFLVFAHLVFKFNKKKL